MISDETMNILKKQYISVTKDIAKPIDLATLEILTAKLGQNLPRNAKRINALVTLSFSNLLTLQHIDKTTSKDCRHQQCDKNSQQ